MAHRKTVQEITAYRPDTQGSPIFDRLKERVAVEKLQRILQEYIDYAGQLREETASIKSVLGMREREIYDAGHRDFDRAVEEWANEFCREPHTQQEVLKALDWLLFTAAKQEETASYWYLTAVQRHGKLLIALLDAQGREALLEEMTRYYPKHNCLPVQQELYRCLGDTGKKSFLGRIKKNQ